MNKKHNIICVDFDGVIHDFKHPIPGRRMGLPIIGTQSALDNLKKQGNRIIVLTIWGGDEKGQKTIADFMEYYKLPFDEITNIKPNADYYIDDKAVRFRGDWEETLEQLNYYGN